MPPTPAGRRSSPTGTATFPDRPRAGRGAGLTPRPGDRASARPGSGRVVVGAHQLQAPLDGQGCQVGVGHVVAGVRPLEQRAEELDVAVAGARHVDDASLQPAPHLRPRLPLSPGDARAPVGACSDAGRPGSEAKGCRRRGPATGSPPTRPGPARARRRSGGGRRGRGWRRRGGRASQPAPSTASSAAATSLTSTKGLPVSKTGGVVGPGPRLLPLGAQARSDDVVGDRGQRPPLPTGPLGQEPNDVFVQVQRRPHHLTPAGRSRGRAGH